MIFSQNKGKDEKLFKAIQKGGREGQKAENQLFKKYTGLVTRGKKQHDLTEDEALDAYSDSMLTIFNHIRNNTFQGDSSIKTYIIRIFTNKCIDVFRKKTTTKSRVHYWTDDLSSIINQQARQNIQKHLENVELLNELKKELSKLGAVCKQIILEYAYGFKYDEIAVRLNPPFKNGQTVKSKKSQCLKKLKKALN
jgi:RNA polymerase sigma-70 factor (ECF subfamily)